MEVVYYRPATDELLTIKELDLLNPAIHIRWGESNIIFHTSLDAFVSQNSMNIVDPLIPIGEV